MEKRKTKKDLETNEIEKIIKSIKKQIGERVTDFDLREENMLYLKCYDRTNGYFFKVLFLKETEACFCALYADIYDCEVLDDTIVLETFNKYANGFDFAYIGEKLEEETGINAKDILSMFREFRLNRYKN